MRLLLVDDDARVLSGLRRQLHGRFPSWQLQFAEGGPQGLELIAAQEFEVVVSDMRMPVVDGAAVLSQTARLHPRAVRLVLSGHADGKDGVRAGSCAHRFLDKPCATDALVSEIERALAVRAELDDNNEPELNALWAASPGLVEGLPLVLASLSGESSSASSLAMEQLADDDLARRVLGVAAAARSESLTLDAPLQRVVEVLGSHAVLALVAGVRLQQAAGCNWSERLSSGAALAVSAYAAGRAQGLLADELADVLLSAFLRPLASDASRWNRLSWLLAAWGVPPRVAAALAPDGSAGPVGQTLSTALTSGGLCADSDAALVGHQPAAAVPKSAAEQPLRLGLALGPVRDSLKSDLK